MLVTTSQNELNRIPVLQQICDKRLTQSAAAKLLNLSVRQVQRLLIHWSTSRKRGQLANNRAPEAFKMRKIQRLWTEKLSVHACR